MRKNKNLTLFWTLLLLILFIPASASASSLTSISQGNNLMFDKNEYQSILDTIDEAGIFSDAQKNSIRANSKTSPEGYKIYSLSEPDLIKILKSRSPISNFISDNYVWIVPSGDGLKIQVNRTGDSWQVTGYSIPNASLVAADDTIDTTTVSIAISEITSSLSDTRTAENDIVVQCFKSAMYHTTFVLISCGDSEYLIPYGRRPELTGLKNGKIYSRKDVLTVLTASFNEVSGGTDNSGNGIPSASPILTTSLISIGAILLCLTVFLFTTKRQTYRRRPMQ